MRDVLLLAGPTASGKTALSLEMARHFNAEIVNADSIQVYANMDTLSAMPIPEEQAEVPHHGFAILDISERCSVGRWASVTLNIIDNILARDKRAILVGGSGLYFKALVDGLADIPDVSPQIVSELNGLDFETLQNQAMQIDRDAVAKIAAGDRQRLVRLISVYRQTGQTLSSFQAHTRPLIDPKSYHGIVVQPSDRQVLYQRIETRFEDMLRRGALDEARAIHQRNLDPGLPAMKAVGLRPLLDHVAGRIDLATAIETAKRDSRRYAKRQYTWFSNQHATWDRIEALTANDQTRQMHEILTAYGS